MFKIKQKSRKEKVLCNEQEIYSWPKQKRKGLGGAYTLSSLVRDKDGEKKGEKPNNQMIQQIGVLSEFTISW